jgi:pseudouridine-5'-phosphate glycosidase
MDDHKFLKISSEVLHALASGQPVVALESSIIAHGMPYPVNIATALEMEDLVRSHKAIPATIALLDGRLRVGLKREELEFLGKTPGVWKVSSRDVPYVLSRKLPGATTVAATARIAHMAGIRILVTGGIGGVHRGAHNSMDISADLTELSQTPVAVVSAGVKSVLDVGLTLEYLETRGITVVTVGQDQFPGFYSRESGFPSPLRLDEPEAIAQMLRVKWELGLPGAVLIANPVPPEHEIPFAEMEGVIRQAVGAGEKEKISGKQVTPFLLQFISENTGGRSLQANVALVKNNAILGATIARLLSE